MPAEYTACVESYRKKGVSTKTAKARCAAMYYKRHGITVNEAAKKEGIASSNLDALLGYDEELYKTILEGKPLTVKASALDREKDVWGKTAIAKNDFLEVFDGTFEVVMAVPGAKCNCSDGRQLIWTDEILSAMASTWTGGTLSANHDYKLHGEVGKILYAWYENKEARGLIKPTPEVYALMKEHPELVTGVSIEAAQMKYDSDLNITNAIGTGMAILFDPVLPQCSPKDGCRVVAFKKEEQGENMTDEEKYKGFVCPDIHSKVVAERDALTAKASAFETDIGNMRKEIEGFKTAIADKDAKIKAFEDAERLTVIASIKDIVDVKEYEKMPLDTLRVIAMAVLETKKKVEDDPITFSGADPSAGKTAVASLKTAGYTDQEIKDYLASNVEKDLIKHGVVQEIKKEGGK
jgi:hypothetical protein